MCARARARYRSAMFTASRRLTDGWENGRVVMMMALMVRGEGGGEEKCWGNDDRSVGSTAVSLENLAI